MDYWRKGTSSESWGTPIGISNLPAISGWESAPGYSFFGAMVSVVWGYAFIRALPSGFNLIPMVLVMILYVTLFYSSYFTEKPRVISSKVISFLNCACMGAVFGPCLNKNLNKAKENAEPRKGAAHVVAIAFCVYLVIVALMDVGVQASKQNKSYDPVTDAYRVVSPVGGQGAFWSQPVAKTTEATPVPVPSTSTTVVLPPGWAYRGNRNDTAKASSLAISPPYEDASMDMTVVAWDTSEDLVGEDLSQYEDDDVTEARKEYALGLNRALVYGDKDTADLVEINGGKYWRVEETGNDFITHFKTTCI